MQLRWEIRTLCCRPATENANAETRGSTDIICRTARSIAQGASDLESFLLKRFPLAMPVENNWQGDPGPYIAVEGKDVNEKDSQQSAPVSNKDRQGILYSSTADKGPALRMRSKAASCMPSLNAARNEPCVFSASLQAALAFEVRPGGAFQTVTVNELHWSNTCTSHCTLIHVVDDSGRVQCVAEGTSRDGQKVSAAERSAKFSASAEVAQDPKRGTLPELLAALERQEISEEQFLEELGHVQELGTEQKDSSTVAVQGNVEAEDILEREELEHVYGDVECS